MYAVGLTSLCSEKKQTKTVYSVGFFVCQQASLPHESTRAFVCVCAGDEMMVVAYNVIDKNVVWWSA